MFEICMALALWGPPPGPLWGPHILFEQGWFLPFLVKIQPCIFKKKMKQLLFTKGPQGPIGATLGTAMNNFCSSSNKVSTHYITWLFSFWIWRRRCLKFAWFWPFGALSLGPHGGHTYYLNNFESPTPKDDSCQVWLKSNHAFSRRRWKCKKFTDDGQRTKTDGNSSLELITPWKVILELKICLYYLQTIFHILCTQIETTVNFVETFDYIMYNSWTVSLIFCKSGLNRCAAWTEALQSWMVWV